MRVHVRKPGYPTGQLPEHPNLPAYIPSTGSPGVSVLKEKLFILIADFITHQPAAGEPDIIGQLFDLAGSPQAAPGGFNHNQHGIHKIHGCSSQVLHTGVHVEDQALHLCGTAGG